MMMPCNGMRYTLLSCVLLATTFFINSFAFLEGRSNVFIAPPDGHPHGTIAPPPERDSDGILVSRATPAPEPWGTFDPCLNNYGHEWKLIASWCLNKKLIKRHCWRDYSRGDSQIYVEWCPPSSYCVGSQESDPDPRWARCEVDIKRGLRWLTNKLLPASVLQCVNFSGGAATGADGLGVQVDNPAPASDQPMPQQAQLFYQGSLSPIQAIGQDLMDDLSGFFIFTNVIDYSQPLQFCVNVATAAMVFNIGLINPKPASVAGLTLDVANETTYREFDVAAGVWKEV